VHGLRRRGSVRLMLNMEEGYNYNVTSTATHSKIHVTITSTPIREILEASASIL
jgi:FAD synthase